MRLALRSIFSLASRGRSSRGTILVSLAALTLAGCAPGLGGDGGVFVPQLETPFRQQVKEEDLGEKHKRAKLGKKSVRLFDHERSSVAGELGGAVFNSRRTGDRDGKTGFELLLGTSIMTKEGPFLIGGVSEQFVFHAFDSKSYALGLMRHSIASSVRLGPLEPEVRFGATLLNFDVFHGHYNFSMFSPRASTGLAIQIGAARLHANIYTEYLWRWFGDSYYVHGISFGLRLGVKQKSPLDEPKKPTEGASEVGLITF